MCLVVVMVSREEDRAHTRTTSSKDIQNSPLGLWGLKSETFSRIRFAHLHSHKARRGRGYNDLRFHSHGTFKSYWRHDTTQHSQDIVVAPGAIPNRGEWAMGVSYLQVGGYMKPISTNRPL